MNVQFDVTITLSEDWYNHEYQYYEDQDLKPTIMEMVHDALEQMDGSHRFGISYDIKNLIVDEIDWSKVWQRSKN